jgi:hypothetical protein
VRGFAALFLKPLRYATLEPGIYRLWATFQAAHFNLFS